MNDTFRFKGVVGSFRPKDRDYLVADGEYVRRPDGKLFIVRITDKLSLERVEAKNVPVDAVIVDLIKIEV